MYQKVIIVGNLGRPPEMRFTPSGQAVTNLNVATNNQYTNAQGERVKETTWWRVSVWGKQAESCNQYLQKGSSVLIEGRMNPDENTGGPKLWKKQDDSMGANYDMTAQTVRFLSPKSEDQGQDQQETNYAQPPDDTFPF